MSEKEFWNLISNMHIEEEPYEWIINHLSTKSDAEIVGFEIKFETALMQAYNSNLLGAAWIIMDGCTEDSFTNFIAWLIGQGEKVYKETVKNPDYLAEYILPVYEEEGLVPELDEMLDLALQAYSVKKKGDNDWDDQIWNDFNSLVERNGFKYLQPKMDIDWNEKEELANKFPKLWKRFAKKPLTYPE